MQYVNARVPDDLKNNPAIADLVIQRRLAARGPLLLARRASRRAAATVSGEVRHFGHRQVEHAAGSNSARGDDGRREEPPADPKLHEFSRPEMVKLRIWRPLADDERLKVDTLSVQEPFVIYMKASFLAGAVLSSPFVFYFLWQFVAAGLYPHEKKYIHVFLPFSLALFLARRGAGVLLRLSAGVGLLLRHRQIDGHRACGRG